MHLLVVGGTSFLGRHVVADALGRGWEVTTFNRGRSGPDIDGVEALRGDRTVEADLDQLRGRTFDVVVDTCGFVPRVVGRTVAALAGSGAHYVFVSSIGATTTWPALPTPDGCPGHACPPDEDADEGRTASEYGRLKAGCERAVEQGFPGAATQVRAGLILGPYEDVGRLPWWLTRIARGGEVLAPGSPDVAMQLVDARDLAAFMLDCGERRTAGTFNATGPRGNTTMGGWLEACVEATGSGAELVWVPDEVLLAHDVAPWTDLPLWMPPGQGGDAVWDAETAAAELAGLTCRPVAETVADTWAWLQRSGPAPARERYAHLPEHGLGPEVEARVLAAVR